MPSRTIFWDEDTQRDFILPDGRLVVAGAGEILPNLRRLTDFARQQGILITGSVDAHSEKDAEISSQPDFQKTFPPHCMEGTPGQLKVEETAPLNPLWIESAPQDAAVLTDAILKHRGEVLLKKQTIDVFSNPNTEIVLDALKPARVVVYGVATDFCVACAVAGLLSRSQYEIYLVEDAIKAIDPKRGEELKASWRRRDVRLLSTHEVLSRCW